VFYRAAALGKTWLGWEITINHHKTIGKPWENHWKMGMSWGLTLTGWWFGTCFYVSICWE